MSEVNKTELIEKFSGVTGTDRDRAQFYLEAAGWNIDVAVGSFFQEALEEEEDSPRDPPQSAQMSKPDKSKPSRFGTISGLKDDSESSDEERQTFYTGGSEHGAGQTVLGPKKKKKASEVVQDMFESAREHGAEEVPSSGSSSDRPDRPQMFRGTGYKLGETEDASEMVRGLPVVAQPRQVDMVLKLWKNGFSVDDGDLRTYSDPANQEFLDNIKKGEVPQELIRSVHGGEVNLNMEDHREEEYVKPKVAMKAFSGEGQRLGSAAPTVVTEQATPQNTQQQSSAQSSVSVDSSQPTTSIQIRLADGSRLVTKFNHSHQVSDIRRYITSARPEFSSASFVLMTTFPNRELSEESQTIDQAKLLNAVIVQRLK